MSRVAFIGLGGMGGRMARRLVAAGHDLVVWNRTGEQTRPFGFPLGQYSNLQLMLTTHACRFFEAPFPPDDFVDGIAALPAVMDGLVASPDTPGLGHGVEPAEPERLEPIVEVSL